MRAESDTRQPGASPAGSLADRRVVSLDAAGATDARLAGGKASALARAARDGLPVVPGFVITTAAVAALDHAGDQGFREALGPDVERAWRDLSDGGRRPLAVRSSSTAEDLAATSMAGRFASVVGVTGWDAFVDAVRAVLDSRQAAAAGDPDLSADHPIAVVVQPVVEARAGGVAFGVDAVTGRSDRIVAVVAPGGPQPVVAGQVTGTRYVLDHDGALHEVRGGPDRDRLRPDQLDELVTLVERAAAVFGSAQDVEFALGRDGHLWLLQSRPVTTPVAGVPCGPVYSPGPVAETFPAPLSRLEQDLWIRPLRRALREVLALTGAAGRRRLAASPLVVCPDGRPAVDIEALGSFDRRSGLARLNPRPRLRRLRAAWRVGRLRSALPGLARDLVAQADDDLPQVPELTGLTDRQLLDLLDRTSRALTALHGHEMLIGLLIGPQATGLTGVAVALRTLAGARDRGLDDEAVVADNPVVLALVPPRIQPRPPLPEDLGTAPPELPGVPDESSTLREALRLRVRWAQELSGRAAWVLGERLVQRSVLESAGQVRHLRLSALDALVRRCAVLWQLGTDQTRDEPLPGRFQLTSAGRVVPLDDPGGGGGTGAGGGVGVGRVSHRPGDVPEGDVPEGTVLVVGALDPTLAPLLPRLAGLVAETGSPLAHLAILAREAGVPVVVDASGARGRLPPGTRVRVDGTTGEITELGRGESRP